MLRLQGDALEAFVASLADGWRVVEGRHLEKEYQFKNFHDALAFTMRVGELAERQGHHPDIYLSWGRVRLLVWTHKINGLTESDFIFAAKADERLRSGD